jgi:hypothetical protein
VRLVRGGRTSGRGAAYFGTGTAHLSKASRCQVWFSRCSWLLEGIIAAEPPLRRCARRSRHPASRAFTASAVSSPERTAPSINPCIAPILRWI